MAQVYSPTPHRIALCALARHLNYHPEDDDVELEGRARRDDGTRLLRARDRHALSRLLMEEATSTEGFREPALRAFNPRLDAFSRADGAPPAFPDDVVVDVYDVDFLSLADRDPDGRVNLKDLLRESLGAIRNVDDLVRLFRDVEPRSSHAVEMRGHVDDYFGDPPWPSPVDPDSIVGVFLRRCCVDFDRLSFEGACKVQSVFAHYVREGEGAFDHLKNDADGIRTRDLGDATRRGLRADAAAGDADDAAAEAFASGGAPSHPFDPRGLADVGVRTPRGARRTRRASHPRRRLGRRSNRPGGVAARLDAPPPSRRTFPARGLLETSRRATRQRFPRRRRPPPASPRDTTPSRRASRRGGRPGSILVLVGSTRARRRIDTSSRYGSTAAADAAAGARDRGLRRPRAPRARFRVILERDGGVDRARRGVRAQGAERGARPPCSNRATKRRRAGVFVVARAAADTASGGAPRLGRRALRVRGGTARERGGSPRAARSRSRRSGGPRIVRGGVSRRRRSSTRARAWARGGSPSPRSSGRVPRCRTRRI